jgi:hypothetical protein
VKIVVVVQMVMGGSRALEVNHFAEAAPSLCTCAALVNIRHVRTSPRHRVQRQARVRRSNLVLTFGQFCGEIHLRMVHDCVRHETERKTHEEACKHR